MKKALLIMSLLAVALAACSRKPEVETQEEKETRVSYERYQTNIKEMKNKVPQTEIIGQVQGRDVFIHRFYDEKNGTNCYFIDYRFDHLTCVK